MSAIPGGLETDKQPPMTLPLRHFIVSLGFLLAGALLGLATGMGWLSGFVRLAHVHVLLAGWICLTIMGAMTQFIPVWSAVSLHSRRLAVTQLWLVTGGLAGFVFALLTVNYTLLAVAGAVMLAGFWVFVYNIARTLPPVSESDLTEAHFALALFWFLLATALGLLLAIDFTTGTLGGVGVNRVAVVGSHATLAVFGAILTTVIGALYQLATMFTQTEMDGIDRQIQRFEAAVYPAGVAVLAGGRLLEIALVARIGGLAVVAGLLAVGLILVRKLIETQVDWTPMLSRYAVVALMIGLWGALTAQAWLADPLATDSILGTPGAVHLLTFGVIGFVVLGTLYHIVPFIIWVHQYSDRLGYEQVPMIDDLYSSRLAAIDFVCLFGGLSGVFGTVRLDGPTAAIAISGVVVLVGVVVFTGNMLLVIRRHSPHSLAGILGLTARDYEKSTEKTPPNDSPATADPAEQE